MKRSDKLKASGAFVAWLTRKNMTTEAFAQQAGISLNTVNRWRGGVMPNNVCKVLGRQKFPDCPLFA